MYTLLGSSCGCRDSVWSIAVLPACESPIQIRAGRHQCIVEFSASQHVPEIGLCTSMPAWVPFEAWYSKVLGPATMLLVGTATAGCVNSFASRSRGSVKDTFLVRCVRRRWAMGPYPQYPITTARVSGITKARKIPSAHVCSDGDLWQLFDFSMCML